MSAWCATCRPRLDDHLGSARGARRRRAHRARDRIARELCGRDVAAQAAREARSRARRDERHHAALRRVDGLAAQSSSDREDRPRRALGRADSAVLAEEGAERRRRLGLHDRALRRRVGARRRLRPDRRHAVRRERPRGVDRVDHDRDGARAARVRSVDSPVGARVRDALGEDCFHRGSRRARGRARSARDRRASDRDRAGRRRGHAPRARRVRRRGPARGPLPRRTATQRAHRARAHHVVASPGDCVRRRERDLGGRRSGRAGHRLPLHARVRVRFVAVFIVVTPS